MIDGGADQSLFTTNQFYVDYYSDSCVQSCHDDTPGLNCGGLAPSWKELFDTADDCCNAKLFWVQSAKCIADSTLTSVAAISDQGSGDWYVDWIRQKCVKDCQKNSGDSSCGGLAKRWDELYSSASACCSSQLSYKDAEDCTD